MEPMNARREFALLFLLLGLPAATNAQPFDIDWHTIAGGGGSSSGGNFTLVGTSGQFDAGSLSGGAFQLQGGFVPGLVVPAAGEIPSLIIQLSGANIIISWPAADGVGFQLEESAGMQPGSWIASSSPSNPATLPISGATKFYRLRKP
jgi:hypothetical protein